MTTKTELLHAGGFIVSKANGNRSLDNGVLITGQNLKAGAVLGKIALTAGAGSVAAPVFAGTGNGVITMDATNPVRAGAKPGAYTATLVAVAANGGTFRVEDPDGFVLGDVLVAATFDDDIKFVIADGATDFVLNDKFTITVTAGSAKYSVLAPAAVDGTQNAAGILLSDTDASAADAAIALVTRDAEVNGLELTWPGGITAPQKAAAIAQFAAAGLIVRP